MESNVIVIVSLISHVSLACLYLCICVYQCIDTGLACDGTSSTCNGKCQNCIAFGPGENGDMFQSTQIIGNKQYEKAILLMDEAKEEITGPVDYRHSWLDMPSVQVTDSLGVTATLCRPAMGYSFAAGTTDGPGTVAYCTNLCMNSAFIHSYIHLLQAC